MKRPSYFQQVAPAAPARRRAGAAVLTPAPLLFRPSGADIGFQEVDASATPARPATKATPVGRTQPATERPVIQETRPSARPVATGPSPAPPPTPAAEAGLRVLERMTQTRTERAVMAPANSAPASVTQPPAIGESVSAPLQPQAAAPVMQEAQPPAPAKPQQDRQTSVEERIVRAEAESAPPAPMVLRDTAALPSLHPRPAAPLPLITPAAPPPRPAPVREAPASGLHIGTLEVRVTAPAPPPGQPQPAPRAMARGSARRSSGGPIARGFGVFGLGQS